jgi:hypothetical protein
MLYSLTMYKYSALMGKTQQIVQISQMQIILLLEIEFNIDKLKRLNVLLKCENRIESNRHIMKRLKYEHINKRRLLLHFFNNQMYMYSILKECNELFSK